MYRKGLGDLVSGRINNGIQLAKNQKFLKDERLAKDEAEDIWSKFNPLFGFRCLHYQISESIGALKVFVIKKVSGESMRVGVRTRNGSAIEDEDFQKVDEILTFKEDDTEMTFEVKIVNDDAYEENEDFYVELYDPDDQETLEGEDVTSKITIIDDDQPGILGFEKRMVTAHN